MTALALQQSPASWQDALASLAAETGFFRHLGAQHSVLFADRGDTQVVAFENLDHGYEHAEDRLPWGWSLAESRAWSVLGLMAHDWTWYCDEVAPERSPTEDAIVWENAKAFVGAALNKQMENLFKRQKKTVVRGHPSFTMTNSNFGTGQD